MYKKNVSFIVMFFMIIWVVIPINLYADNDIESFMDSVVGSVVVDKPGVFKGSRYNVLHGGGFSFRLKQDLLGKPPISFKPPSANVSCSGMNFDAGMIGIMDTDTFEQLLSQAGGALAWGVMIGIVYSLPGIGDAFQKLQQFARYAQLLSQNACTAGIMAGQAISEKVGTLFKKNTAEQSAAEGDSKSFTLTLKNVMDTLEVADVVRTEPYHSLRKFGITDENLLNVFASATGVIDTVIVDSSGNEVNIFTTNGGTMSDKVSKYCKSPDGKSISIEKCVKTKVYAPLNVKIVDILYRGIHCSGSSNSGECQTIYVCKSMLNNKKCGSVKPDNVTSLDVPGIKPRIASKLDNLIENFDELINALNSNSSSSSTTSGSNTTNNTTNNTSNTNNNANNSLTNSVLGDYAFFSTILSGVNFKSIFDYMISLKYRIDNGPSGASSTTGSSGGSGSGSSPINSTNDWIELQRVKSIVVDAASYLLISSIIDILFQDLNYAVQVGGQIDGDENPVIMEKMYNHLTEARKIIQKDLEHLYNKLTALEKFAKQVSTIEAQFRGQAVKSMNVINR